MDSNAEIEMSEIIENLNKFKSRKFEDVKKMAAKFRADNLVDPFTIWAKVEENLNEGRVTRFCAKRSH